MKFMPSKLFHAVVVTGAALTAGCAGSDDVTDEGSARDEAATVADTQADTEATPVDLADPAAHNAIETTGSGTGKCPPGSERPFPPCFWIL
jgi:hypothetical protein